MIGKKELDNFILPWETYPVIAVTSRLMTTGVDAKTCKCIVIDRTINSLSEFKQIIGRGTRIDEEYGKQYFTIMDFRRATNLFADPDFDGEPVVQLDLDEDDDINVGDIQDDESRYNDETDDADREARKRYVVDNVPVWVVNERVQYLDSDGKLITESLKDYTKQRIKEEYRTLDHFLKSWTKADRKRAVLQELRNEGILLDALREEVGDEYDDFDLICHVAFDRKPKTRSERAKSVLDSDYFARFGEKARKVIGILLDKYSKEGIENIEDIQVLKIPPFDEIGSYKELVQSFGGRNGYTKAIRELERLLYQAA
jgi:type I restriction enzyme R subunit